MTATLLKVQNLRVEVRVHPPDRPAHDLVIVDDVSFDLAKGQVLGLIGESGAGKSTIGLASMAFGRGGCRITGGEVWLGDTELLSLNPEQQRELRGARVAYVAQSAAAAFNPAHRLEAQVTEVAVSHGIMNRRQALAYAVELFAKLGLPEPQTFGRRFPHQVSGGQLQRAMTAMALCAKPDLIVFDEPTTALDVTTQIEVLAAIKEAIRNTHTAALYITHDLAVVAQIADHIMVLRDGKQVEFGPVGQIINRPAEDYTRQLVAVRSTRKTEAEDQREALLSVDAVTAAYGDHIVVLDDVSVAIPPGQTLALVGESGSGKSTLARVVTGLLPPRQGEIRFAGEVLPPRLAERSKEQLRALQMIYQMPDVALNPQQTVRRAVGRPLQFYFGERGKTLERQVVELLEQIELGPEYLDRYPGELSGGQKQRICIARALAARPSLIICDEVTSALDPLVADGILKLLLRLQQQTHISYLFITHDIATVRAIADSVAVMYRGKVVRSGPKSQVLNPPFDDYTELLLSSVPELQPGWLEEVLSERRLTAAGH